MAAYSPEASKDINAIYEQELARPADPAGLAVWQSALANGSNLTALRSAAAYSAEGIADINGIYMAELGRAVDAAGLASNQVALVDGSSLSAIRSAEGYSSEAAGDIQNFLNGLDVAVVTVVAVVAVPGYLGLAESSPASGSNLAATASSIVADTALDPLITQIDQTLGRTAAVVASDVAYVRSQVVADLNALVGTSATWSNAIGSTASETMKFIGSAFVADLSGGTTTLTSQQQAQYNADVAAAGKTGTLIPPVGATLIDSSPLLTAFCSNFRSSYAYLPSLPSSV